MQFFTGWKEKNSRNHAVRIDGLIYSSGVRPIDPQTGKLIENRDFSAHMSQCLDNLDVILREAGATVQNVVKLTVYLRNMRNADNVAQEVAKRFDADKMPTATILEMHRFEDDLDVLIHCIAADSSVEVTHYEDKRYAPWSGAVAYGDYISLSAVVPEATSITYDQKMFADEVAACFTEMERLLQKAGSDVQHALRMRVYVRNMLDRIIVNEVTRPLYEKFPLRVIVEPARLMHEQRIAIECDAYKKDDMEHLRTEKGQLPTGPFSQGIRIGSYLWLAGVRAIDPVAKRLINGTFKERTIRCMENLQAVLEVAGSSLKDAFEARLYLRDMNDLPIVEEVFETYFDAGRHPVWAAFEVSRMNEDYEKGWDPYHDIEIEVSAYEH